MGARKMTTNQFVNEAKGDYGLAMVPMRAAATRLGVSRSRLDQWVAAGKLDSVSIQDDDASPLRGITIASLRKFEDEKAQGIKEHFSRVSKVIKKLRSEVLPSDETVTYGEAMGWLDLHTENPPDRSEIGRVCGQASRWSYDKAEVLISALVVQKQTGLPSEGFFELVQELRGISICSPKSHRAARERERVWREEMDSLRASADKLASANVGGWIADASAQSAAQD